MSGEIFHSRVMTSRPVTAAGFAIVAAFVIAVLTLMGACSSSPPARFYTLSDTAPEVPPPSGVTLISITGVTIPGELNRPELVRRVGPNQLNISGLDRWAAPLDETIRRVLSDDLARRVPRPAPGPQHFVAIDIREFYGDAGCNVTLRAAWTLKQAHSEATPANIEEIHVPSSGACPVMLPETMSIALGQLSDRIIAGVARSGAPAAQ